MLLRTSDTAWAEYVDNATPPADTDPPRHAADDAEGWLRY